MFQLRTSAAQPDDAAFIPSPDQEGLYPRGIVLEAVANMRDLGGLPIENSTRVIRKGLISRSAAPTYGTENDKEKLLSVRDILTIIDFRTSYETKNLNFGRRKFEDNFQSFYIKKSNNADIDQIDPIKEALIMEGDDHMPTYKRIYKGTPRVGARRNSLGGVPRKRFHIPLINDRFFNEGVYPTAPAATKLKTNAARFLSNSDKVGAYFMLQHLNELGLLEMYKLTLEFTKREILTIFRILTSVDNYPISYFCSLGKDRTGMVTALILSCLGVPRDLIIDDYHQTEVHLAHNFDDIRRYFQKIGLSKEEFVLAPKHVMQQLLEYLDRTYGSVPGYLNSIGFTYEEQQLLRAFLTEEASNSSAAATTANGTPLIQRSTPIINKNTTSLGSRHHAPAFSKPTYIGTTTTTHTPTLSRATVYAREDGLHSSGDALRSSGDALRSSSDALRSSGGIALRTSGGHTSGLAPISEF